MIENPFNLVLSPNRLPPTKLPIIPNTTKYLSDIVWESDNPAGIPSLRLDMHADSVAAPYTIWGTQARSKPMTGTYAFYCDDYKFEALWNDPKKILSSGCETIVEPNFSINDFMPPVVALYHVFRKRWLSRFWQDNGKKIIVDLNVAPKYAKMNLLGVPKGWNTYCTRVHKIGHAHLDFEYEIARDHAGCEPLFIVYGGCKRFAGELCKSRNWHWIPDTLYQKDNRRKHG